MPEGVFRTLLGSAWHALPAAWRAVHDDEPELRLAGRATVERGPGPGARLVAAAMRFPVAGDDVPVRIDIRRDAAGETWRRDFAGRAFTSRVSRGRGRSDGLLEERFGPIRVGIALVVDGDRLHWIVRCWSLFGIPLPRAWAPGGDSSETATDGRFRFDIGIGHPLTGVIVRYQGWLEPVPRSRPET